MPWLPPSGTGELFGLSPEECLDVVRATVEAIAGRIPVIASVGFGPRVGADMARGAEVAGADGILILPPYYGTPDPVGLAEYYREVAAATSLGIMPYARDAAVFTPEGVEQMALDIPNMVAFKDGRGDVRLFQRIREHVIEQLGADRWSAGRRRRRPGRAVLRGRRRGLYLVAGVLLARGVGRAAAPGSRRRSTELGQFHQRVVRPIYELRQRGSGYEVAVMKAAMELLGHRAGVARPPLGNLRPSEVTELADILRRLQVPTAADRAPAPERSPVSAR